MSYEIKRLVEEQMTTDDETTTTQLQHRLSSKGYSLSLSTILRCREALGWTYHGSAYCQLIGEDNKRKRLEWAQQYVDETTTGGCHLD